MVSDRVVCKICGTPYIPDHTDVSGKCGMCFLRDKPKEQNKKLREEITQLKERLSNKE